MPIRNMTRKEYFDEKSMIRLFVHEPYAASKPKIGGTTCKYMVIQQLFAVITKKADEPHHS